jgi:hypothetical protein
MAAIFAAAMAAFGLVWWGAVLAGLLIMAAFVLLERSGRYVVQPGGGLSPMRRDEMALEISRRAGLNGFVTLVLGVSGLVFYYGVIVHGSVPVGLLGLALALGVAAYVITEYWLRRA